MSNKTKDLRVGDVVLINTAPYGSHAHFALEAEVESLLSVQFTARWEGTEALSFLFYNDEGETWKRA